MLGLLRLGQPGTCVWTGNTSSVLQQPVLELGVRSFEQAVAASVGCSSEKL